MLNRQSRLSIVFFLLCLLVESKAHALSSIIAMPSPALVGAPVTVTVTNSAVGCNATIIFGDGTSAVITLPPFSSRTVTHSYRRAGFFTLSASGGGCGGAPVGTSLTVNTITTAPFSLTRVELRFENGRGEITVPKDYQGLKVFADVLFTGSGLLTAAWEVDGRTLSIIHEYLTFGSRKVLTTPDLPPLPTFEPGLHTVRFGQIGIGDPSLRTTSPGPDPIAYYYVEARSAVPLRIDLLSPTDGATRPEFPVTFRWREIQGVASYRIEIFAEGKIEPIFAALSRKPSYTLPEIYHRRFTAGSRYAWQVKGLDQKASEVAKSEVGQFTWQSKP